MHLLSEQLLSPVECDEIIALGGTGHLGRMGYDGFTDTTMRNNYVSWVNPPEEILYRLSERLTDIAKKWCMRLFTPVERHLMHCQLGRFGPGTYYHAHQDFYGNEGTIRRMISMSIQLTDPDAYDGGDLVFTQQDISAPRQRGVGTWFSSADEHEVTEVTTGERHSLVAWAWGVTF